jgi:D-Tyr-tRNAtyr deacylase
MLVKVVYPNKVWLFDYGFVTVSQFTLYGFLKGNKPDFHVAMAPQRAKPFYATLVDRFRNAYNSDAIKGVLSMFLLQFLLPFLLFNKRF